MTDADQYVSAPTPSADECFCDQRGLGVKGVSCGDCPRDYARADAARPVPADVLEKCARLLGLELHADERFGGFKVGNAGIGFVPMSDGDLLLAILNKVVEMGHFYVLTDAYIIIGTEGSSDTFRGVGRPLDAAFLAFAQLEPPHDR